MDILLNIIKIKGKRFRYWDEFVGKITNIQSNETSYGSDDQTAPESLIAGLKIFLKSHQV